MRVATATSQRRSTKPGIPATVCDLLAVHMARASLVINYCCIEAPSNSITCITIGDGLVASHSLFCSAVEDLDFPLAEALSVLAKMSPNW